MSAILGALSVFFTLAFVATTVAFASDNWTSMRSTSQRAAFYPADSLTDDERILTTPVAAPVKSAPATPDPAQDHSKVAHAA